jgi:hypothetical protein
MRLVLAIALGLLAAGYHQLAAWYPDAAWLQGMFFRSAWPLTVSLAALTIILFAARLRRRDPQLLAWSAWSLAGCLLVLPLFLAKIRQEGVDSARDAAMADLREQVQTAQRRVAQERAAAARAALAERGTEADRFSQYEGRMDPASLAAVRDLDARMQQAVKEQGDAYRKALDENPTLGPSAWITFRTREQLETERDAFRNLYQATRAFAQFIQSFEDRYSREIEALDLKPPADRVAIAEMTRILQFWRAEQAFTLRELDVELIAAALNALDTLHEAWGAWSYSPRENSLEFDDPAREARFHEAMQRFIAASEAASALLDEKADTAPAP